MDKRQWYAIGIWFFVIGFIFCIGSIIPGFFEPDKPIVECGIYYVIERLVYRLVGTLCVVVSFACWLCGWFENEEVK